MTINIVKGLSFILFVSVQNIDVHGWVREMTVAPSPAS